ncbi:hypothetical protein FQA39_LY06408 [Lamprigera yunnana]|nr:hypothetical protein FQA39_LY06408 [Lamprigera yunnana]
MEGDVKQTKQLIRIPGFIIPEGLDGADLIPVEYGGRLVSPSISINELGKQLLKASIDGNVDDIKLLMSKGAPFTADWLGTSPLHFAAQNNHLEICEILLRAGISKDARTKVDRTPLHIAVYEGHIDIVTCLLNNKADVDCKDLLSMTPLHWAAQNCHAEIVQLLIQHGAQTDVVNKFNLTPLDIALQCERQDIAEIISMTVHDPEIAAQNLTIAMEDNSCNGSITYVSDLLGTGTTTNAIPIVETVLIEDDDDNSVDPETPQINHDLAVTPMYVEPTVDEIPVEINSPNKFCESIKLLREHGITMLPADDDNNILSSILETGHSVVLTEVGKQVLNSTKPFQSTPATFPNTFKKNVPKIRAVPILNNAKKIITITPEEFLAMAMNQADVIKPSNGKIVSTDSKPIRRIVMKKNKVVPITSMNDTLYREQSSTPEIDESVSDTETLMRQLIDARRLVEEYKQKFLRKKAEADIYKQQLRRMKQLRNC